MKRRVKIRRWKRQQPTSPVFNGPAKVNDNFSTFEFWALELATLRVAVVPLTVSNIVFCEFTPRFGFPADRVARSVQPASVRWPIFKRLWVTSMPAYLKLVGP